jgi:multiple sugar transport system permease protein
MQKPAAVLPAPPRRTLGTFRPHLLRFAAAFVVLMWLFPIYWIILTSFKPIVEINSAVPSFIFTPTLENYRDLFGQFEFTHVLLNSLVVTVATVVVCIVLGVMAAYALGRMNVPGEKHIALWILSLRFLPPIAVAIPFYLQWQELGLLDTRLGLVIVYVAFNLPFAIWLLRGFLADVPRDLEEAAMLDGLSRLAIIWRIVVPVILPGVASTAMFTFVFTWNEYLMALMLTSVTSVTVPVTIAKFVMPYTILWGDLSAAVVIQLVPMLVVVFLLQRHIVRGMTLGAVK